MRIELTDAEGNVKGTIDKDGNVASEASPVPCAPDEKGELVPVDLGALPVKHGLAECVEEPAKSETPIALMKRLSSLDAAYDKAAAKLSDIDGRREAIRAQLRAIFATKDGGQAHPLEVES